MLIHLPLQLADGWGYNNMSGGGHSLDSGKPGALKQQTIGLLHAIAYLRSEPPWLPMHHSLFLKIELLCASGPASDSEA